MQKARQDGLALQTERTILISPDSARARLWVNMTRVKGTDGHRPAQTSLRVKSNRAGRSRISSLPDRLCAGFGRRISPSPRRSSASRETATDCRQYELNRDDILSCRRSTTRSLRPATRLICTIRSTTIARWNGAVIVRHPLSLPAAAARAELARQPVRCISTTHEAMAAIRVMSTCMAMGEAAGRAAKLAVQTDISPRPSTCRN